MLVIGRELQARGHDVEWVAHEQVRRLLDGETVRWLPAEQAELMVSLPVRHGRGMAEWLHDYDVHYAVADAMMPLTEDAIAKMSPQVLLADYVMSAGGIAARRAGISWATSFASNMPVEAVRPIFSGLKFAQQVDASHAAFEGRWGLTPSATRDSRALTLAYTIPELVGDGVTRDIPGLCYVGPLSAPAEQSQVPFPWERLDGRPLVYVALGTLIAHRAARFYRAALDGLAALDVQVVISAPEGVLPPPWGDAIVVPYAPQADLIARSSVVIGQAGMNSTWDCLRLGVPVVLAPGLGDQRGLARRIAEVGAGLRISLARATPIVIADSVQRLLTEPSFATEARRLGEAGLALGGERRAADALEALAQQTP